VEVTPNASGLSRSDCGEQRDSQDECCEHFHIVVSFLRPFVALAAPTANFMFCRLNSRHYENRNSSKVYYNYFAGP